MRPTTSYRIVVRGPETALDALLDDLIAKAHEVTQVDQSGMLRSEGTAFVRVREKTDDAAIVALAREIVGSDEFSVTTGYGVHQRVIKP